MMHDSVKIKSAVGNSNSLEQDNGNNISNGKMSRKQFFKRIGVISLLPLAGIWLSTAERTMLGERSYNKIVIPAGVSQGVSFYGKAIVSRTGDDINIFSAKCTHLGCIINNFDNGELVCPCHGSRYSAEGKVLKGPAGKPLEKLSYKLNPKTGEITVEVPA